MTSNDDFFQGRKPAAVLKHAVLAEYFTVFTSMVGRVFPGRPLWLLDGYAGPGMYAADAEGAEIAGSPIVALRLAQKWSASRDIRCLFIEKDPQYAAELVDNVAPYVNRGLTGVVLNGEVKDKLPTAWQTIGSDPVVTFLDPFGVAMPRRMMTNTLLSRPKPPSEVLLNINVEAVGRLGGYLERRGGAVEIKRGCHEKGVERADEFLGGTWWRAEFVDARMLDGSAAQAAEMVVQRYRKQVEQETGTSSMSIPVRRRPGHPVLFHLTLFYRHVAAGYKFADASSRAMKKWREAYRKLELDEAVATVGRDDMLFDLGEMIRVDRDKQAKEQERRLEEQWVAQVAENIRSGLRERGSLRVGVDVRRILGSTLSLAGETVIWKAWDQIVDEGHARPRSKKTDLWRQAIVRR